MPLLPYARYSQLLLRGLLVLPLALAVAIPARAAEVWVITDSQHPVQTPPGATLIELDQAARIEAELKAQLPSEPGRAAAIVQQRLKEGGTDLQRRIARAYQGVTDAWSLSVTTIPAVVVDQRYVVYGDTDVERALARIEAYRRANP